MTNGTAIKERVADRGLKLSFVAQQVGLSHQAFDNRLAGRNEFKAGEIERLIPILGITSLDELKALFFARQ